MILNGKTTFILTDRDTGKIVEKREEHNMVTNALRDIFDMPRIGMFCGNFTNNLSSYLPIYNNLLHGLVLFGENISEKSDDYLMNMRYNIIATAGTDYTGTDAKRGTFNSSQSGEIENGYRFVWDFAPEKALGTIKCASLSSPQIGNMGASFSAGSVLTNAYDLNSTGVKISAFNGSGSGSYAMNYGANTHYFYNFSSATNQNFTIYKYRMADPDSIGICSSRTAVLEKSYKVDLPFFVRTVFPNVYNGKLYIFNGYYSGGTQLYVRVLIGEIDIETGECRYITKETEYLETQVPGTNANASACVFAVFEKQLYVGYNTMVYVYNFDGTLVKEIPLLVSSISGFFLKDNKLGLIGKYSSTNTPCYVILDSEPVYLPNASAYDGYYPQENGQISYPYVAASTGAYLYILLRTDYLATINNLSEPIEKTDRHALQVRYEITDG